MKKAQDYLVDYLLRAKGIHSGNRDPIPRDELVSLVDESVDMIEYLLRRIGPDKINSDL